MANVPTQHRLLYTVTLLVCLLWGSFSFSASTTHAQTEPPAAPDQPSAVEGVTTPSATAHYWVTYDSETGEEVTIEAPLSMTEEALPVIDAYTPDWLPTEDEMSAQSTEEIVEAASFSALTPVANPQASPYSRNVKIFILFVDSSGNNREEVCSGSLIHARFVLTAGHCVYSHRGGEKWAKRLRVVPAYGDNSEPYGAAQDSALYSWEGWTKDQDPNSDMGFIKLNRPIGALTGWFPVSAGTSETFYRNNRFYSYSYPATSPYDGKKMYGHSGSFDLFSGQRIGYIGVGFAGQDGSTIYDTNKNVYAVLSGRSFGIVPATWYTYIDIWRLLFIVTRISEATPDTPDLIPLSASVTSERLSAGDTVKGFSVVIFNESTANLNKNVSLKVYLSTNETISDQDTLLGARSVTINLNGRSSTRLTLEDSLTVPEDLGGTYWLGVIIDETDANPNNNSSGIYDVVKISVDPFVPAPPKNLYIDANSQNNSLQLTWNPSPRAIRYHIYRATSERQTKTLVASTATTSFVDLNVSADSTYYYAIRAESSNGQISANSATVSNVKSGYTIWLPLVGGVRIVVIP